MTHQFGKGRAAQILEKEISKDAKISKKVSKLISQYNERLNFIFDAVDISPLSREVAIKNARHLAVLVLHEFDRRCEGMHALGFVPANVMTFAKNVMRANHGLLLDDLKELQNKHKKKANHVAPISSRRETSQANN